MESARVRERSARVGMADGGLDATGVVDPATTETMSGFLAIYEVTLLESHP